MSGFAFEAPAPDGPLPEADEPTFSVVIAAYQSAETIAAAVDSALGQSYPAQEVIVCDDGSTDGTPRELARYEGLITIRRQPNAGEAAAKNRAVRAARAEYVAILDADDVFLPRRLEALAALARSRPDLDILTTDATLEVEGRAVRRCYTDSWRFETADQRAAILERNFVFGLAAVRRARLLDEGGFDESLRYATDWDCWIRLILAGARVGLVAEPLARYRLRSTSLSAQRSALLQGRAEVLDRAAANPALTEGERAAVQRRSAEQRHASRIAAAYEALAAGFPEARRLALEVARTSRNPPATRLRAAIAAAAPGLSRAVLRRRTRRLGRGGPAGVMLPGDQEIV